MSKKQTTKKAGPSLNWTEKLVASEEIETGELVVHARARLSIGDGNDSICGLAISDILGPEDVRAASLPINPKINCTACIQAIKDCRRFTKKDVP